MKTIITRPAKDKDGLTGDIFQIDQPYLDQCPTIDPFGREDAGQKISAHLPEREKEPAF